MPIVSATACGASDNRPTKIIAHPRHQMTPAMLWPGLKLHAKPTTVSSRMISQAPRETANRAAEPAVLRPREKWMDNPVRKKNAGAHKCVTQRVANSDRLVAAMSSGETCAPEK